MRREGVCENLDVRKNRNSKFSHRSLVMLFQFYFYYKIEYFYREKPLHLNAFQTHKSTNYYQGSIVRVQLSVGKKLVLFRFVLTKIE